MATPTTSAAPGVQMSTMTVVAIITAVGVVILCLLTALTWLLIRAIKRHKQLLADLDERGLSLAQAQKGVNQKSVARPRAVLRRNTMLPFNAKSGWGTLPSMETIGSAEAGKIPAPCAPPKSTEPAKEKSRLSWPFHARKTSSHLMEMKPMKGNRLSTVLEDPKPSSIVPVLKSDQLNRARPSFPMSKECGSRPSSSQSMLQYHPAFRNDRPSSAEAAKSRQRSRSFTDLTFFQNERPQVRARSASLCSQLSGKAPDVILPPLPLDIARIKDEARTRHELRQVPSLLSMSSVGSANSSILNPRPSPVIMQSNTRPSKITKRNWNLPAAGHVMPLRDSRQSLSSSTGWTSSTTPFSTDTSRHSRNVGGKATTYTETKAHAVGPDTGVYYPDTTRTWTTPKRISKTQGSPERYRQGLSNSRNRTGSLRSPKRQPSQASSRSSCGNPFQWDPTPLSSTGKPSALKGSPSARQGHKRKTSVRISLVPTVHPIQSRVASLVSGEDKENLREGAPATKSDVGLASTHSFSLSRTDLDCDTSLRATLTSSSPDLPLVAYDQSFATFSSEQALAQLEREEKRLSTGSNLSLSRFPLPSPVIESDGEVSASHPPSNQAFDLNVKLPMPETPFLVQYPFREEMPDRKSTPSPTIIDIDGQDPERPALGFQTPSNNSTRIFQSACATIPEESSVSSQRTLDFDRSRYDSPAVSPKTKSPPRLSLEKHSPYDLEKQLIYELPDLKGSFSGEYVATINPALIMKDSFNLLNTSIDLPYQAPEPSNPPSPTSPCSPRPAHALLPTLSPVTCTLSDIPCLAPSSRSPTKPAPVRSSIQQLRRMNSDALDARKDKSSRGERRYLRLGRPESTQFNESWVDDVTCSEGEGEGEADTVTGAVASSDDDDDEAKKTTSPSKPPKPSYSPSSVETTPRAKCARRTIIPFHISSSSNSSSTPPPSMTLTSSAIPSAHASPYRASCASSVWDESDAFWTSTTPTPTRGSPTIHAPSPAHPNIAYTLADMESSLDMDMEINMAMDTDVDLSAYTYTYQHNNNSPNRAAYSDDDDATNPPILDAAAFPGFPSPSTSYSASAHASREFDFVGSGLVTPAGSPRRRERRSGVGKGPGARRSRRESGRGNGGGMMGGAGGTGAGAGDEGVRIQVTSPRGTMVGLGCFGEGEGVR